MNYKGTIVLTIISLLERLSYCGVRVILVLYVTDPYGLKIDQNQILEFYGYWALVLVVAGMPFSLMTDKIIGQKRSIYIGGILTLLGYLMLMVQNQYTLIVSLLLILSGISLVKPSATILIGRQFKKENKKRTLAYMVFFMGINIGAFIGALGIGYLGEVYAWKYGFIAAALSTIAYLLISYYESPQLYLSVL